MTAVFGVAADWQLVAFGAGSVCLAFVLLFLARRWLLRLYSRLKSIVEKKQAERRAQEAALVLERQRREAAERAELESRREAERKALEERRILEARKRRAEEERERALAEQRRRAAEERRRTGEEYRIWGGPARPAQDAQDFEAVCAEFMRTAGFADAEQTRKGPDGGVDVVAKQAVGQAKFLTNKKVTADMVRALYGSKHEKGVEYAMFFTYGPGYTSDALRTAESLKVLCYVYKAAQGRFVREGYDVPPRPTDPPPPEKQQANFRDTRVFRCTCGQGLNVPVGKTFRCGRCGATYRLRTN